MFLKIILTLLTEVISKINKYFNIYLILIYFFAFSLLFPQNNEIIIDSNLTFEEAISGLTIPDIVKKNLILVNVNYYSFDGKIHQGQLVVHKDVKKDIEDIFEVILKRKFPIKQVVPISVYDWSDEKSMQDNNTSAFNYRTIEGTKTLSKHSTGKAIDINPLLNPQIKRGKTIPKGSTYNENTAGTILKESWLVREFTKRGWQWGGNWKSTKDYQHFEKK